MLAKLNGHKGFLVKICVLLVLLVLGRGLKEQDSTRTTITQVNASGVPTPMVLTASFKNHIFPSTDLRSSLN